MNLPRIPRFAPVAASVVAMLTLGLVACDDDANDATDTTTGTSTVDSTDTTGDSVDTTAGSDDTTEDTADTTGDTDATAATDDTGSTPGSGTGDDGAPATEEDFVAATAQAIGFQNTEISDCLAQELIDGVGFARIEASGVSPEEFVSGTPLAELNLAITEEDAPVVQAAMADCGDIVEASLEAGEPTAEQADCVRGALTNDLMAEFFLTQIVGLAQSPELQAALETLQSCAPG